jgi:hypothetical protein
MRGLVRHLSQQHDQQDLHTEHHPNPFPTTDSTLPSTPRRVLASSTIVSAAIPS